MVTINKKPHLRKALWTDTIFTDIQSFKLFDQALWTDTIFTDI